MKPSMNPSMFPLSRAIDPSTIEISIHPSTNPCLQPSNNPPIRSIWHSPTTSQNTSSPTHLTHNLVLPPNHLPTKTTLKRPLLPPSNMIPSRILMCLFPVIWGGWVWPVFILQYCECVSVSTVDVLGHTRSQCVSSPKVRRGHKRHVSFVRIVFFNREHLYNLTLNSLTHILLTYSHHASWHPTCERFWD